MRHASARSARTGSLLLGAMVAAAFSLALVTPASGAGGRAGGKAIAIGGSKKLQARDTPTGPLHALRAGDTLILGEEIVLGAGVTATLRTSRPPGVDADIDLITLKPTPGTPHLVSVSRQGTSTIIELTPS